MTSIPQIMLNNGRTIPQLGFGVFLVRPEDTTEAVIMALQAGYRHIDTAEMYGNEREVGEAIAKSGLDRDDARSIGVSNFQPHHLRRLYTKCEIIPAVDQVEVNPYLTQQELRDFCAGHQIAIEAWSPLARGGDLLHDPVVVSIAKAAGKTPAQVVLRWHIQHGNIVFPKSATPGRIRENIDIFDFELSGQDLEAITSLNRDQRTGPDPDRFDAV